MAVSKNTSTKDSIGTKDSVGTKEKNVVTKSKTKASEVKTKVKVERKYLTATVIIAGIIELIDDTGEIKYYRQRGIGTIPDEDKMILIGKGFLRRDWHKFKELPKHITIKFEDSTLMGRASASFPYKQLKLALNL